MKRIKKFTHKSLKKVFTKVKPITIVDLTNSLVNSKIVKKAKKKHFKFTCKWWSWFYMQQNVQIKKKANEHPSTNILDKLM